MVQNATPDLGGRTCVQTQKVSGRWVTFQCYADPADAERIAARLRSFGARVALRPERPQEVAGSGRVQPRQQVFNTCSANVAREVAG